ncbi:MAG: hypothetical protein UY50_C0005G0009 [Parcubacteria group bacterium GW2011_GWA2_49_9]|nr:MAG: hypothetical protein UY50_C0005G0009 [Parcubacteria group bacterium GW2011_GWA2_49_9]
MTKVYIEQLGIPELPFALVFWPNFRFEIPSKRLFLREIMEQYQTPFFTVVKTPEEADFFAIPFEFFYVYDYDATYLQTVFALAKANGKKVLLFDYTDYVDRVPTLPPHAVLFRVSVYRHHKQPNEIVMPYFVEHFGLRYGITPRTGDRAIAVGYCGYSQFKNSVKKWRAYGKHILQQLALLSRFDRVPTVHTRGIFWRQRAMRLLQSSSVLCRFVVRPFYSGHRMSITLDANDIRREYVENLRDCDLALCYENCIVRVPSGKLANIAGIVQAWTKTHPAEPIAAMEGNARVVYDDYLRLDRFFSVVFDREQSPYAELLFTSI